MGMKRNGKSLLAKTVALSMVVGSMAPMSAMAASNDIGGHWAESTITSWQNRGLIGGYEDGTFKPDKAITRAEFVRLINQALGFSEAGNVNFSDVSSADWYYNDVAIAMGKQYCSGFPDGTFQPNAVVTRGQAASFIANAKNLTSNAQAADSIADSASMPDWAKGSIGAVIGAGYMSGYPDGTFQSDKVFTRAEAVSTLDRVINGASSTPGQNEPDREDSSSEVTDTSQAKAPDGYSGHSTGRKGSSSSSSSGGGGGGGSSTSDKVEITSANAADYTGKTIRGKAKIYIGASDLTLENVKFTEPVEVLSDSSVVRAADTTRPTYKLILKGTTSATDNFTINTPVTIVADSASNTLSRLIVKAKTALAGKLFVNNIQASATTIMGDESSATTIEAEAPVNTEAGSTVATINVVAGSEATLDLKGEITTIETKGTGEIKEISIGGSASPAMNINKDIDIKVITVSEQAAPKIAVQEQAKITNLNTTGDSKPEVTVSNNAKVENVEASGSSAPKVDLKEGSSVGNIVHDSTEKIDVAGSGTITGNITATDPTKVNIGSNVGGNTDVVEVTVQSIAVKSQPKKLSYNVKDDNVLDLTGLVITVTYSDGTTKDVALADFGDKITTTPKNGATLTAANNGKPVTISMDGKTATTSNLSVAGGSSEETATLETEVAKLESGIGTVEVTSDADVAAVIAAIKDAANSKLSTGFTATFTETSSTTDGDVVPGAELKVTGTFTVSDGKETKDTKALDITVKVAAIAVESVSIDPSAVTMEIGVDTTKQLTANITPVDATNKTVTWTSSDEDVAKVNAGLVTCGTKAGTTTITATVDGKSATATVTTVAKGTPVIKETSIGTLDQATKEIKDVPAGTTANALVAALTVPTGSDVKIYEKDANTEVTTADVTTGMRAMVGVTGSAIDKREAYTIVVAETLQSITDPDPITRVDWGTEFNALGLPATVTIVTTDADSTKTTANVTWTESDYNKHTSTKQTIKGTITLPEGVVAGSTPLTTSIDVTLDESTSTDIKATNASVVTALDNTAKTLTVAKDTTVEELKAAISSTDESIQKYIVTATDTEADTTDKAGETIANGWFLKVTAADGKTKAAYEITVSNDAVQSYAVAVKTNDAKANDLTATAAITVDSKSAATAKVDETVTVTVTVTGTPKATGTHTIGLTTNTGTTITPPAGAAATLAVTAGSEVNADTTFAFTFIMPAKAVDDLVVTNTFAETSAAQEAVEVTSTDMAIDNNTITLTLDAGAFDATNGKDPTKFTFVTGNNSGMTSVTKAVLSKNKNENDTVTLTTETAANAANQIKLTIAKEAFATGTVVTANDVTVATSKVENKGDIEAAKITGFDTPAADGENLTLQPTINGTLTSVSKIDLVEVKIGATGDNISTDCSITDTGVLSIPVSALVAAKDTDTISVTYTVTADGETSAKTTLATPIGVNISTAQADIAKIRADKATLTTGTLAVTLTANNLSAAGTVKKGSDSVTLTSADSIGTSTNSEGPFTNTELTSAELTFDKTAVTVKGTKSGNATVATDSITFKGTGLSLISNGYTLKLTETDEITIDIKAE